jgi:very-short-patch-repair endonuclease
MMNKEDHIQKPSPFPKGGLGDSSLKNGLRHYPIEPIFSDRLVSEGYLPYNKNLKQFSRNLRNHSTRSEIILWKELRAAQLGYTFNRQKPILNYIVDFFCKPLNLVIEVDGESHLDENVAKRDKIRQSNLEKLGLHFLRFNGFVVFNDLDYVIGTIEKKIAELEKLYPEAKRRRKNG